MQAEQQQQQPGANQPSALQIAKQQLQMHHLRDCSRHSLSSSMTVAARIDMSLTLNQMMDSMMAGVEKTGVLLLILQLAAMQQLQSYRALHLKG